MHTFVSENHGQHVIAEVEQRHTLWVGAVERIRHTVSVGLLQAQDEDRQGIARRWPIQVRC